MGAEFKNAIKYYKNYIVVEEVDMSGMTSFEAKIASLIIESLNLEDVAIEDINPEEPLFNEGLGLDSIDALELSVSLSQEYGINLRADDPNINEIFSSLRALASYVGSNSKKPA